MQDRLQQEVPEALVNIFGAPPVEGLGTAGGFKIIVEDRGDNGLPTLQNDGRQGRRRRRATTRDLQGCSPASAPTRPGWTSIIDRTQAKDRGVSIDDVFDTLQVNLGSLYINDFNRFGRTWQVNVQAGDELPRADRRPQAAEGPQRPGRDGAAGATSPRCAT